MDERAHPKIRDLGSSRFCDLRWTLTSGVGTPLFMPPEMCEDADYTGTVEVYSFALIVYKVFAGQPAFLETLSPTALMKKVVNGARPPLPLSMDTTIQQIIKQDWSVDPTARGSFEEIFKALRQIRFKMTPAVDMRRVAEFVALVDPSVVMEPAKQFRPSVKKRKVKEPWGDAVEIDVPDGIIAHLTRECRGNVHDRYDAQVTSGSFEKETWGADPHSVTYDNDPRWPAKNAADLEIDSGFRSAHWAHFEDIPHTRNN
jgi:serine/threonine protein kinase